MVLLSHRARPGFGQLWPTLVLPATLAQRLGLEAAADELVDVGYRPGQRVVLDVEVGVDGAVQVRPHIDAA